MFELLSLNRSSHILTAILVGLLCLWILNRKKGVLRAVKWMAMDYLLLAYFAFFCISVLFKIHPNGQEEALAIGTGLLLYWVLMHLRNNPLSEKAVQWMLALGSVVASASMVQWLFSANARPSWPFIGDAAFHSYPNALAGGLLVLMVLHLWPHHQKKMRATMMSGLVITSGAFFLTQSRGAVLAWLLVWALALFMKKLSWRHLMGAVLGIVLAASLSVLQPYSLDVTDRFTNADESSAQSVNERFEFWEGAIELTLDRPWVGAGPGSFEFTYPTVQDEWLVLSDHPHNWLLKVSTDSGIPAVLCFLAFGLLFLWKTHKAPRCTFVLSLVALAMLLHNLVDYNLNFTYLNIIFWGTLGLLRQEMATSADVLPSIERRILSIWAMLLIVAAVSYGGELVWARQHLIEPSAQSLWARYPETYSSAWACTVESFHAGEPDNRFAKRTLDLNGKNELQFHWLYLLSLPKEKINWDNLRESYLDTLTHYTEQLSLNQHQTVTSLNPEAAQRIYQWFIEEDSSMDWQSEYEQFLHVWKTQNELFNERFGTSLSTTSADAYLNELIIEVPGARACH